MNALDHEKVAIITGERSGLTIVVAVHSTALGQAVGGCRLWHYPAWPDALADVLRLSSAMTLKCALAGLALGGGKSVIHLSPGATLTPERRRAAMLDLGDLIDSLGGSYGVGEDVGTTAEDMAVIHERTQWAYGLPEASGGVGESSEPTALGIYEALRVTARRLFGTPDLRGRTLTIVGLGQVGSRLAGRLVADGARVAASDVDTAKRDVAEQLGLSWIDLDQAYSRETDFLVPAALGGTLNTVTVPGLNCAAIVGPANNQLASDDIDDLIAARGILWAPDFLVSAGGVAYGTTRDVFKGTHEDALDQVTAIGDTLRQIYDRADAEGTTPMTAALAVARERIAAAGA